MTIFTDTRTRPTSFLEEYQAPLSDVLGFTAEDAIIRSPTASLLRMGELSVAESGYMTPEGQFIEPDSPLVDAERARSLVKDARVDLTIPDTGIRQRALDILIDRKRDEVLRESVLSRAPSGVLPTTARIGAMLAGSAIDPLNVASAFIPVVGEERYASMLAQAGSLLGRTAVRARIGALEGAVGQAAVEPIVYGAAQQEQADYHLSDSLLSIGLGTALGGGLHMGLGAAADAIAKGASWHTARATGPVPRLLEAVPTETREAALRASVSQAMTGRHIDVEPIVTYAGGTGFGEEFRHAGPETFDTTIRPNEFTGVEGITVYHGSPHTFDRFEISDRTIGTGEGAQAYGHGLYVAESRGVGEDYRTRLSANARITALSNETAEGKAARQLLSGANPGLVREWITRNWGVSESDADAVLTKAMQLADQANSETPGALYEARIHASPDDFLDWDKPLSEQSAKVREALLKSGMIKTDKYMFTPLEGGGFSGATKPATLIKSLGDVEATRQMREAGIAGIKYLDAGSRDTGEGSRNYVIFDDKLITAVKRNDESLLPPPPKDLRAIGQAAFAPEAYRLADFETVATLDAKLKLAPADEKLPEVTLEQSIEDLTALASALDAERAAKVSKPLKPTLPKNPERTMPKRPVLDMLKEAGGVRIGSPLAGELEHMGITARNTRGLFKATGRGAADNFVRSEHPLFASDAAGEDLNDYIDEREILDAIRDEMFGAPRRTPEEQAAIAHYQSLKDAHEGLVREEGPMPEQAPIETYQDMVNAELAPYDELADIAEAYGRAVQAAADCGLRRGTD